MNSTHTSLPLRGLPAVLGAALVVTSGLIPVVARAQEAMSAEPAHVPSVQVPGLATEGVLAQGNLPVHRAQAIEVAATEAPHPVGEARPGLGALSFAGFLGLLAAFAVSISGMIVTRRRARQMRGRAPGRRDSIARPVPVSRSYEVSR